MRILFFRDTRIGQSLCKLYMLLSLSLYLSKLYVSVCRIRCVVAYFTISDYDTLVWGVEVEIMLTEMILFMRLRFDRGNRVRAWVADTSLR